jgi:hypothetical protein
MRNRSLTYREKNCRRGRLGRGKQSQGRQRISQSGTLAIIMNFSTLVYNILCIIDCVSFFSDCNGIKKLYPLITTFPKKKENTLDQN